MSVILLFIDNKFHEAGPIRPTKKYVVLPFATDPKFLKSMVGFKNKIKINQFFKKKKCIEAFKTEKYQPKEGVKERRKKILLTGPCFGT